MLASSSYLTIRATTSPLSGIQDMLASLAQYPYGCIEQTVSSTFPNALLSKIGQYFPESVTASGLVLTNIQAGVERIKSMQQADGGFAYWP